MNHKNQIGDRVVCRNCGRTWTRTASRLHGSLCTPCLNAYDRVRRSEREVFSAHRFGEQVSNATLMKARKQPRGCSNIRWRIELRRRMDAKRYDLAAVAPR
jgi:hypothetical protein